MKRYILCVLGGLVGSLTLFPALLMAQTIGSGTSGENLLTPRLYVHPPRVAVLERVRSFLVIPIPPTRPTVWPLPGEGFQSRSEHRLFLAYSNFRIARRPTPLTPSIYAYIPRP